MKFLTKNNIIFTIVILILAFAYLRDFNKDKNIEPVKTIETVATTTEFTIKESTDSYDIDVKYPNEPLDKDRTIEREIKSMVDFANKDWSVGGGTYDDEQEMIKSNPDYLPTKYQLYITYKKFESKMLETITYVFEGYTFTGGAHGNTSIETSTFDKTGKVYIYNFLNLKENNNDIILTKLLESKLKVALSEYSDLNMLRDGLGLSLLKPDGITIDVKKNVNDFSFESNFKNFIILDEGIKFIFNSYQVAPYTAGSPSVVLTWDELKPYLINKNN